MAIPSTSEHQEAAEMFINFMCETDIGKANAEYIGYTTPMELSLIHIWWPTIPRTMGNRP